MTRRDWWIGIGLIVVALVLHAALPRYDWRQTGAQFIRIDRWAGRAERGYFYDARGWVSTATRDAEAAAAQEAARAQRVADEARSLRESERLEPAPKPSVWDEADDLLRRQPKPTTK